MSDDKPNIEYQLGSIADFDDCKYLFLRALQEPNDNSLRLIIEEAVVGRETEPEVIGKAVFPLNAIETLPGCRVFLVDWKGYVAYTVTDESRALIGSPDDKYEGRLFRAYSSSSYMDFVRANSWTFDEPDLRRHWKISCLNHVVDVVSSDEPKVHFTYARQPHDWVGVKGWSRATR